MAIPRKVSLRDVELARGRFLNKVHAYDLTHPKKFRTRKKKAVADTAPQVYEDTLSVAPSLPVFPPQVRDAAAKADAIFEQVYGARATEDTKTNLVLVFAGDEARRVLALLRTQATDPRS